MYLSIYSPREDIILEFTGQLTCVNEWKKNPVMINWDYCVPRIGQKQQVKPDTSS